MTKQAKSCADCWYYRDRLRAVVAGSEGQGMCIHPPPKRVPEWVTRAFMVPLVSAVDGHACPTFSAREGHAERYRERYIQGVERKLTKGMGKRDAASMKRSIREAFDKSPRTMGASEERRDGRRA